MSFENRLQTLRCRPKGADKFVRKVIWHETIWHEKQFDARLFGTKLIDTSEKNKISESAEILKGIFYSRTL